MARYIDADKVLDDMLCEMAGTGYQAMAMNVIKYAETADVVPKSEVEQLKRNLEECEIGYEGTLYLERCKLADEQSKVREIFEEIEKDGKYAISFVENHKSYSEEVRQAKLECYKDIQNYIAELKKKYAKEGK